MHAISLSLRTLAALLAAFLFAAPLARPQAQEPPPAPTSMPPGKTVKVLRVDPGDVVQLATLLGGFGVEVRMSQQLGLITVTGHPGAVARVEEAIRDIEAQRVLRSTTRSPENVTLTVHLLGIVEGESSSVPAGPLQDVVAELKKTFPFGNYKLLETLLLRARVGQRAEVSGIIPTAEAEKGPYTRYGFSAAIERISGDGKATVVSINDLRTSMRIPVPTVGGDGKVSYNFEDIGVSTSLEAPDGKTVVVGKSGSRGGSQGYFVVLTAKVVQ
jgi:hypothetical protein